MSRDARYIWVAVGSAYSPAAAADVSLHLATSAFNTKPTDTPPNQSFLAALLDPGRVKRSMFADATTMGRGKIASGDLRIANKDGGVDDWRTYGFDGRTWTLYYGLDTAAFPSGFTVMFKGEVDQAEFDLHEFRLKFRDMQARVEVPLQTTKYAGTNTLPNGLEGVTDLKGKPKPLLFGKVRNISPPLVNSAKLIYQLSANGLNSVDGVRDGGVSVAASENQWDSITSGVATTLYGIAWHDTPAKWVIVGASGVVLYSANADGSSPAAASAPGFGATDVMCTVYEPVSGNWIAGAKSGKMRIASDPTGTWSAASTNPFGGSETVNAVTVDGRGNAFATGSLGTVAYSADGGDNWTMASHGLSGLSIIGVAASISRVIIMSSGGATAYSVDGGVSYTTGGVVNAVDGYGVTFCDGYFTAVSSSYPADSPDGLRWTPRYITTTAGSAGFLGVAFGGPKRIVYAFGGDGALPATLWTSAATGIWTRREPDNGVSQIRAVAGNSTTVILVGDGGTMRAAHGSSAYASEADLLDDTLAPVDGTYKYYLAGGMIRLGSKPVGQVTCDATQGANAAARTAAQIWVKILDDYMGFASGEWSASDVTTADSANAAVCGLWTGTEEWSGADALDWCAKSIGAGWWPDLNGVLRFRVLVAPSTTRSVATLTEEDIFGLKKSQNADQSGGRSPYRTILLYAKNYTPQTLADLGDAVTDALRSSYGQEWKKVVSTDASVQTKHPRAPELEIESGIAEDADAATEVARVQTMRGTDREFWEFTTPFNTETVALDIGSEFTLKLATRYGLSAGQAFVIIGLEAQITPDAQNLFVECWG